ncbi:MAG: hypothetical protein HQM09_06705 [Candidatus Riflebacteria bacterium]|nr:hypothetical protein [Candidatus Riflebacteria bacterium]
MKKHRMSIWRLAVAATILALAPIVEPSDCHKACAEDAGSRQEAQKLFKEALGLKQAGKFEDAARTFEKAVKKDRSVLGEDDNGLIKALRELYSKRIEKNPSDVEALEGMGFVTSVCEADFATAIGHYTKVVSLTQDAQVKARVTGLIDGLKAQLAASGQAPSSAGSRPAGDSSATASGSANPDSPAAKATAKSEEKLKELTRSKDDMEDRCSKIEADIKSQEEENERNHRMYLSSNDRRYKRKEDSGDQALESKKAELDKLHGEIDKIGKQIDGAQGKPDKKPDDENENSDKPAPEEKSE